MNKRKRTIRRKPAKVLHVAVVVTVGKLKSNRSYGDWSCFVAASEQEAVGQAFAAKAVWEASSEKRCGPYDVYVGTIARKAVVPITTYTLEALSDLD